MIFYRYLNKPRVLDDLLVRVTNIEGREREQFVVSSEVVTAILEFLHNIIGHHGRENTTAFVMHRFYWSRMQKDIANWIDLELGCIDFLTLEPPGVQDILVITDHFTKFAVAVPTKNQTAKTTADALLNHFIIPYGLSRKIHSD